MTITFTGGISAAGQITAGPTTAPINSFVANAVSFDGTNDFIDRQSALIGAVDNKQLLISFWFRLNGGDATNMWMFSSPSNHLAILRFSANIYNWSFRDNLNVLIWDGESTQTFTVANSEWVHILMSLDAATLTAHLYINNVLEPVINEVLSDGLIDWDITETAVGSRAGGSSKFNGDLSEVYITNEHLLLTLESNRRKFIDADGKPVDLGSDGSTPTDTPPLIYLSGPTIDWPTNKGGGGSFNLNGTLDTALSSPSD